MISSILELRNTLDEMFRRNEAGFLPDTLASHKVFISSTSGERRAVTHCGVSKTLEDAYQKAKKALVREILSTKAMPRWIYMGFVDSEERLALKDFYKDLGKVYNFYYRRGIALDEGYRTAFLEQELNGAVLIRYDDAQKTRELHHANIRLLLKQKKAVAPKTLIPDTTKVEKLISFTCTSIFFDGEYHTLHDRGVESGMRTAEKIDSTLLQALTRRSTNYLATTVREEGSFVYGYFPTFDREAKGYNTIRHCLGVMAFLEGCRSAENELWREAARKTYRYYMDTFFVEADGESAYVVDWENHNEIRLGGLGLAIIMILSYATVFGTEEDIPKAIRLGNFILKMQNAETGQFTHVLQHPSLAVKDMFRIVYYAGEASYGLVRLYDVTGDKRYLDAVGKAFDFFIENGYEKYFDHWLSYAANELTRHCPDDRYYAFGLRNAFIKLNYIRDRPTTWPTFLELLCAAFLMIKRIRKEGRDDLLKEYDLDNFYRALAIRVVRQRDGVFYPEKAMFYKNPTRMLYGVHIRHEYFRTRNDDVAHHLLGYFRFLGEILPLMPDLLDRA